MLFFHPYYENPLSGALCGQKGRSRFGMVIWIFSSQHPGLFKAQQSATADCIAHNVVPGYDRLQAQQLGFMNLLFERRMIWEVLQKQGSRLSVFGICIKVWPVQ